MTEAELSKKDISRLKAELESRKRVIEELNKSFKQLEDERKLLTEALVNAKLELASKS